MRKYRRLLLPAIAAAMALAIGLISVPAAGTGAVMYSSVPSVLPGNVASVGFEANQASEFGDRIKFVPGSGGFVRSVTVVLSSWGCESGHWYVSAPPAPCVTSPGETFSHDITLNIYADNGTMTPGLLLGSVTQTFDIPYRPSADPVNCPLAPEKWYSAADSTCYNGLATTVTFDFPSPGLAVPSTVIWGVAYRTTQYGNASLGGPIGASAPCYSGPGGCGYDSLNVGSESLALVGTDVDPNGVFWNTLTPGNYCDGGAGGVGTFRLDDPVGPCNWTGYRPMAEFSGPTAADCKDGGWKKFTSPAFKNQGACMKYFQDKAKHDEKDKGHDGKPRGGGGGDGGRPRGDH